MAPVHNVHESRSKEFHQRIAPAASAEQKLWWLVENRRRYSGWTDGQPTCCHLSGSSGISSQMDFIYAIYKYIPSISRLKTSWIYIATAVVGWSANALFIISMTHPCLVWFTRCGVLNHSSSFTVFNLFTFLFISAWRHPEARIQEYIHWWSI